MKKKLSELKERELVCITDKDEALRVTGSAHMMYQICYINNDGEVYNFVIPKTPVTIYPSKDIADYEAPKPKKPFSSDYWGTNGFRQNDYIVANNKYVDYIEKELEELKSKVFVPFKARCNEQFTDMTKNAEYEVIGIHNDCYILYNNDNQLDKVYTRHFTKI